MKIFKSGNKVFKTPHIFKTIWKPYHIDGMLFWSNSSEKNIVIKNSKVVKWKDISGNLNNAFQNNDINSPLFEKNVIDGHSALYFDLSQFINIELSLDYYTIITVVKMENDSFLYEFGDTSVDSGFFINGNDTDSIVTTKFGYSNSTRKNTNNNTWLSDGSTYKIINHQYGGTNLSHTLYINNNYQSLTNQNSDNPGDLSANNTFKLGINYAENDGIKGYIFELLIYNKSLDSEERNMVADYLNNKYSIF